MQTETVPQIVAEMMDPDAWASPNFALSEWARYKDLADRITAAHQRAMSHQFIEVERLQAELARLRVDAGRYAWLRQFYASANFEPEGHAGMDLIFSVPQGPVSGNCDKTIDALAQTATQEPPQ